MDEEEEGKKDESSCSSEEEEEEDSESENEAGAAFVFCYILELICYFLTHKILKTFFFFSFSRQEQTFSIGEQQHNTRPDHHQYVISN